MSAAFTRNPFDIIVMQLRSLISLPFLAALVTTPGTAQTAPEPPNAPVAVLMSAMYNDQANFKEASDSAKAGLATDSLRAHLQVALGDQVRSYPVTDSLATAPSAQEITGGIPCNVKVACALAVARAQEARWVVMSKVSKTSNLIWLLSAQLIRVDNGEIILDDSTELKGDPGVMIPKGMRIFADRVVRTVKAGGVANDFPS